MDLLLALNQEIKLEFMTQHFVSKAQKAGGVIKYMWYSQQVERQKYLQIEHTQEEQSIDGTT